MSEEMQRLLKEFTEKRKSMKLKTGIKPIDNVLQSGCSYTSLTAFDFASLYPTTMRNFSIKKNVIRKNNIKKIFNM